MKHIENNQSSIHRINGYLHRVTPITDQMGKIISHVARPLMCEFRSRDAIQVILGAALLAMPVALTEEAWYLGSELSSENIFFIAVTSIVLISIFVYYNVYRAIFKEFWKHFLVRVIGTYLLSLAVSAFILFVLGKLPLETDPAAAIKSIILVTFPAALSGTISDMIK